MRFNRPMLDFGFAALVGERCLLDTKGARNTITVLVRKSDCLIWDEIA